MSMEKLGAARLYEEMGAGRSVMPLFRDLLNDYGTPRIDILTGALSAGLGLIHSLQKRGVKLTVSYHQAATAAPVGNGGIMYRAAKNKKPWEKSVVVQKRDFGAAGSIAVQMTRSVQTDLMSFVEQVRTLGATLDATRSMFVWNEKREDTPLPNEGLPLKVEVVAMPKRETTTTIMRDSLGNITSSAASERDAA